MTSLITYQDGNTTFEGYCAYPKDIKNKVPAVLVVHDWSGKNEFACNKADAIAKLGYIGFAVDMYGNGKVGTTKEEKTALIKPLQDDRALLRSRITAAFDKVKTLDNVDTSKIGIIGFCFGGLVALDLARSGADVKATVTFHAALNAPEHLKNEKIISKILILHGYADPMVKPDQVTAIAKELTDNHVNWEINMYGNVMHGFTNPEANDPNFGTVYSPQADMRSWRAMREFFMEVFSE
jgi:dienelactone hydrolase